MNTKMRDVLFFVMTAALVAISVSLNDIAQKMDKPAFAAGEYRPKR
jgi:hypothetical protein